MTTIAIIGGGFCGALTAVHVLRNSSSARVVLIERSGKFGPGLAYSTPSPVHFLNVPAGNMSAFDDDPGHFLRWTQERDPAVTSGSFLARAVYGQYLQSVLAAERARAGGRFREITGDATSIGPMGDGGSPTTVALASGESLEADRVVLALGNALPRHPPVPDEGCWTHPAYLHNPWDFDALNRILPDEPVLIVGAGLTMMDVVMSLAARDHAGRILAVSRHGLLPRPHRSPSKPPVHRDPPAGLKTWNGSARVLLHTLRDAVQRGAGRGTDWRDVVTSIRSITPDLWKRMDACERDRFLIRLRSYWDVVRHRAAPETGAAVADLIASRRLSVRAGRLLSLRPSGALIDGVFRPRGSCISQVFRGARVINCLGPDTDIGRCPDRLVRQLLASGAIASDPHAIGIEVSESGFAIGSDGVPSTSMLVVGPMRRAQYWENTAVPELRRQAAQVALAALGCGAVAKIP